MPEGSSSAAPAATSGAAPSKSSPGSTGAPTPSKAPDSGGSASIAPAPSKGTESKAKTGEQGEDLNARGETKAEEAARKRWELDVKGKKVVRELTDDETRARLQKAEYADEVTKEGRQQLKKAQELLGLLEQGKADPNVAMQVLQQLGYPLEAIATTLLSQQYEQAQFTPEQKLQQENETLRKQLQEREHLTQKQREQQEQDLVDQQVWARMQKELATNFQKHGLSDDPFTMSTLADIGQEALDDGWEMTPEQLVQATQERMRETIVKGARAMPARQLMKELGDEKVREILAAAVEDFRQQQGFGKVAPPPTPTPEQQPAEPYMTEAEARRKMGIR